jgi:hypothetical protein
LSYFAGGGIGGRHTGECAGRVAAADRGDYVCRPVDICSVKRPVVNQTVGEWSVGNVVAVPRRGGAEAVELLRGMELF